MTEPPESDSQQTMTCKQVWMDVHVHAVLCFRQPLEYPGQAKTRRDINQAPPDRRLRSSMNSMGAAALVAVVVLLLQGLAAGVCLVAGHGQHTIPVITAVPVTLLFPDCGHAGPAPPSAHGASVLNGCRCFDPAGPRRTTAPSVPAPSAFCMTYLRTNASYYGHPSQLPDASKVRTLQDLITDCDNNIYVLGTVYVSALHRPLSVTALVSSGEHVIAGHFPGTIYIDVPSLGQRGQESGSFDPFDFKGYPTAIEMPVDYVSITSFTIFLRVRTDGPSLITAPWFGITTVGTTGNGIEYNTVYVQHVPLSGGTSCGSLRNASAGLGAVVGLLPAATTDPRSLPGFVPGGLDRSSVGFSFFNGLDVRVAPPAVDACLVAAAQIEPPHSGRRFLASLRIIKQTEPSSSSTTLTADWPSAVECECNVPDATVDASSSSSTSPPRSLSSVRASDYALGVVTSMSSTVAVSALTLHGASFVIETPSSTNSFSWCAPVPATVVVNGSDGLRSLSFGGDVIFTPCPWAVPSLVLPTPDTAVTKAQFVDVSSRSDMLWYTALQSSSRMVFAAPMLCSSINATTVQLDDGRPLSRPFVSIEAPVPRSMIIDGSMAVHGKDMSLLGIWDVVAPANTTPPITIEGHGVLAPLLLVVVVGDDSHPSGDTVAFNALPTQGSSCDPLSDYITAAPKPVWPPTDAPTAAPTPSPPTPAPPPSTPVPSPAPTAVPVTPTPASQASDSSSSSDAESKAAPRTLSRKEAAIICGAGSAAIIACVIGAGVWVMRRRSRYRAPEGPLPDSPLHHSLLHTINGGPSGPSSLAARSSSAATSSRHQPTAAGLRGPSDPSAVARQRVLEHVAAAAWGEEADDPCGPVAAGDAHDGAEASEWDAGDAATSVSHQAVSVVAARLREREARLGAASDAALPPPPPAIPGYTWVAVPVSHGSSHGGSQAVAFYPRPDGTTTDVQPPSEPHRESCHETMVSADFKSRAVTDSEAPKPPAPSPDCARAPPQAEREDNRTAADNEGSCYETLVSADYESRAGATESTFV